MYTCIIVYVHVHVCTCTCIFITYVCIIIIQYNRGLRKAGNCLVVIAQVRRLANASGPVLNPSDC